MGFFSKIKITNKAQLLTSKRLAIELLEERCVPTAYYWHPGSNKGWNYVTNWRYDSYNGTTAGETPLAGSSVYFTDSNDCNLAYSRTLTNLILDGYTGTINLNGYELSVYNTTGSSSFTMNSGTISLPNSASKLYLGVAGYGSFSGEWSGGDFVRSGGSVNGLIELDRGTLNISGGNINNRKIEADLNVGFNNTNGATINFVEEDYGTCIIDGNINVTNGSSINFYSTGDALEIVQGDQGGKTITNNGTLLFAGTSTITLTHPVNQNYYAAVFELRSGEVDFAANDVAQLNQNAGYTKLWGGTYLGRSGSSEVKITGGYLQLNHAYGNPTTTTNTYSGSHFNLGSGDATVSFGGDETGSTAFSSVDFFTNGDITFNADTVVLMRFKDGIADSFGGNNVAVAGTLKLTQKGGTNPVLFDELRIGHAANNNSWTGNFYSIGWGISRYWKQFHHTNGSNDEIRLVLNEVSYDPE